MYNKFIEKHRDQIISNEVYTEVHHIVPRYQGGDNSSSNLLRLTYRQHILAHLLLYRRYGNIEDLTAYRLMKSLPHERKSIICKMIGQRHVESGHIQALGRKNAETGWINAIKTPESLSKGGKHAGQIAKETGQIYTIRTDTGSRQGGITQGNRAKESGQIQSLSKYKGRYVLIAPDGTEYQHVFQMEQALNINRDVLTSRCRQGNLGYSRRPKTAEELANAYSSVEVGSSNYSLNKDVQPVSYTKESKFIFVDSEGTEFEDIKELASKYGISVAQARSRCKRNNCGFSRKYK